MSTEPKLRLKYFDFVNNSKKSLERKAKKINNQIKKGLNWKTVGLDEV